MMLMYTSFYVGHYQLPELYFIRLTLWILSVLLSADDCLPLGLYW
jgi:hypothetical protein